MSVRKSALVVATTTPQPPSNEGFITPKQLAERLHVKVSTIWEWTRRREKSPIPHFSASKKVVYFRWSEVVRWVEAQRAA